MIIINGLAEGICVAMVTKFPPQASHESLLNAEMFAVVETFLDGTLL